MARKKKHPKLPNGFGSIKKLSGNRSNPYAVYPPTVRSDFNDNGSARAQKALCYVSDWYIGFYALMEYQNGTFDAEKFQNCKFSENDKEYDVVSKIIASYNNAKRIEASTLSFSEVYKLFYKDKFENPNRQKQFSRDSIKAYNSAYKKCSALYDKSMKNITKSDMQPIIDNCTLGYGTLRNIKNLFSQMYAYSLQNGIVETDYSKFVTIDRERDFETGEPFTEDEIKLLWKNKGNPDIQIILIMIYTGMRIGELEIVDIDFEKNCFKGGLKTVAGKERIIPFPDSILEYIKNFDQKSFNAGTFRDKKFYNLLQSIGMDPLTNGKKHTPHDCRHTFSWLCDKYGMDDLTKHLIMGHSLGNDVEKSVYGHRTFEELQTAINKLEIPDLSLTCC